MRNPVPVPSRRALVALVLLAACGAATGATDAPAEKPVRLPDFAVNERAFGKWGVALHFHTSLLNRITEAGPPRSPYTVEFVIRDSPGHRAGLVVGDQVVGIEGRACDTLSVGEMRKLFYETGSGLPLALRVSSPFTDAVREVTLKPDLNRTWLRRQPRRYVYWGIDVVPAPHEKLRTEFRRTKIATLAELHWSGPALYLAPRPDGGVEWWRRRGARTTLAAGSVLELHDDGTFTVQSPPAPAVSPRDGR